LVLRGIQTEGGRRKRMDATEEDGGRGRKMDADRGRMEDEAGGGMQTEADKGKMVEDGWMQRRKMQTKKSHALLPYPAPPVWSIHSGQKKRA